MFAEKNLIGYAKSAYHFIGYISNFIIVQHVKPQI